MEPTVPEHFSVHSGQTVPIWDSTIYRCIENQDRRARSNPRRREDRPAEQSRKGKRVLLIGRLWELALYRAEVLRSHGFRVITPRTVLQAMDEIRRNQFDIAVLSYTLSSDVVEQLAEQVRQYCPKCPLIVISDTPRFDKKIDPTQIVIADDGPAALIAALHRVGGES